MYHALICRLRRGGDDTGVALAAVLGLMLLVAVVSATVLTVAASATGTVTAARAKVQAEAAAQAGVDALLASMNSASFVCSASATFTDSSSYSVVPTYRDASGATLVCPAAGVVSGTPSTASILSAGSAGSKGTGTAAGNTARVLANVTITVTSSNSAALNYALFSDGGFTLKNNTSLTGTTTTADNASLYSNGTIDCGTSLAIQGSLTVQGDVTFGQSCTALGGVWAGGNVSFANSVTLAGDLYAAGTGLLSLANTSQVQGNIVTNGPISITSNPKNTSTCPTGLVASVCGSAVSLGGGISLGSNSVIGGSAYATGAITATGVGSATVIGQDVLSTGGGFSADGSSGTTVGGSVRVAGTASMAGGKAGNTAGSCQNGACGALTIPAPNPAAALPATLGYPASSGVTPVVNKPAREQLPRINSADTSAWSTAGWTVQTVSSCSAATTAISNEAVGGKLLLVVTGCATGLSWSNQTPLVLNGDLAIMSPTGFTGSGFDVKTADGVAHSLEWIVPSDSAGITWNAVSGTSPTQYSPACTAPAGAINVSGNTNVYNGVKWFMYSPCQVTIKNPISNFSGQVYAGTIDYPPNSALQMVQISVPGATNASSVPPTITSVATVTDRTDVAG